jgi:hypothetical protein
MELISIHMKIAGCVLSYTESEKFWIREVDVLSWAIPLKAEQNLSLTRPKTVRREEIMKVTWKRQDVKVRHWHMLVASATREGWVVRSLEPKEFENSLGNTARSCLKKKKKKERERCGGGHECAMNNTPREVCQKRKLSLCSYFLPGEHRKCSAHFLPSPTLSILHPVILK